MKRSPASRRRFRPGFLLLLAPLAGCQPAESAAAARLAEPSGPAIGTTASDDAGPPTPPAAEAIRSGSIGLTVAAGISYRAELPAFAASLDGALHDMAARVPYTGDLAMSIAVERDYVAEAIAHGAIGEAVDGKGAELALVYDPDDGHAYRFALARRLLVRAGLAASLPPALADGAALWLSQGWYGRSAEDWLAPLARAGAFPTAAELLEPERSRDGSRLLAAPVAACWIGRRPGRTLREKLAGDLPSAAELDAQLAALAASASRSSPTPPVPVPLGARDESGFLRGVSFAMLNSIDGGYHAPSVDREYARLADLSVDAVSLMPFAYQRDPRAPGLIFLDDHPASETDVGLLHAARRAHERGFAVLWKPHIWVGRDSWPGEVEMSDEAGWSAWWSSYRRFVLHHAMLAAWAKAELFSVGVELDRTTVGPLRERAWRELIASVRAIYPGRITYAANWDRAANVPFWDAVDFVGVDSYHPLSTAEEASDAELARGADEVAGRLALLARRARRPLLLTEVGFPARRAAWREPNQEGGALDEEAQLRAYRALFAALEHRPWLAGMFVWKSFSDEARAAERSRRPDFRFLGRPAEKAVRDYFRAAAAPRAAPVVDPPAEAGKKKAGKKGTS